MSATQSSVAEAARSASKAQILDFLLAFARQRPGLDPRNYGDWKSYRSEQRSITRDLNDVEALVVACRWRSITADELLEASRRAFSGRLSIDLTCAEPIDYTTGSIDRRSIERR